MTHLSLSVALIVCPAVAFGQHPVPANLSLADAITLARANNPAYRQTSHDRAPAAWGVRNAYASLLIPTVTAVTQQYLTVLQARDSLGVAREQLAHDVEFLRLAQARYDVGPASLIDVRQAQVARGNAEVVLLRAQTTVDVEKLRLFQQIGVTAPVDIQSVQLTDTFVVQAPTWKLNELLTLAEQP